MEADLEMVGKAFVERYYHLFDQNQDALVIYQLVSMLTFEGKKILRVANIYVEAEAAALQPIPPFHQHG